MSGHVISQEYEELNGRINKLKISFGFTKEGLKKISQSQIELETLDEEEISCRQRDLLRGYILLCHAEIEDYLESLALKLVDSAWEIWLNDKTANYNLASLYVNSNIENTSKKITVKTKSFQVLKQFKDDVKRNHGIKKDNLKNLFYPLGYLIDSDDFFDFTTELGVFGTIRGEIAHASTKKARISFDLLLRYRGLMTY